jgi:DNA sulfur modification protein DndD
VILDELTLHNVGVFGGRQTLRLTPPDSEHPIVLIGGLNGCGKTTILDALQLALYGPLARLAGRRGSYENLLRDLIHHGAPPGDGAAVELTFHTFREGSPRYYRIRRSWRTSGKRVREDLEVYRDGTPDTALSNDWAEHVEALIPRGIAALFFFDGEKIESLAELHNSRELLSTAIGGLLGLDLTTQLVTDLNALERRHRERVVPFELRGRVERLKEKISDLRKAEELAFDECANTRVHLERAEKRAFELDERYRFEGGELFEQRKELETRRDHLKRDVSHAEGQLRSIAAGCAPLLLVRTLLTETVQQAEAELSAIRQRELLGMLAERDKDLLRGLKQKQVDDAALIEIKRLLTADRKHRQTEARQETVVELDADLANHGRRLMDEELDAIQRDIESLSRRRAALLEELTATERRLATVPTEDAINQLQTQRDDAHRDRAAAEHAHRRAEQRLQESRSLHADARRSYERVLNDATEATLEVNDSRRIADHAARVRETLAAFRTAATSRHIGRIQQFVLICLQQLLRKQDFITDLQIDPETFGITFYTRDGKSLQPHQLSAGERQIVAVSLLWGLAQASGRSLPVAIDTPLGRLDSSHRAHLTERYFPNASHQVLLLSTDTEIDDPAWQALRPFIGHAYQLEHDPQTGTTTARAGYFWEGSDNAG